MPTTHTSLCYHVVFAPKNREPILGQSWRDALYRFVGKVAVNKGYQILAIGGMSDHVHIMVLLPASVAPSEAVNVLKSNSSRWINDEGFCPVRFQWQEGYGAFTVSQSAIVEVKKYILNQETHHRQRTFADEYAALLNRHGFEQEVTDV